MSESDWQPAPPRWPLAAWGSRTAPGGFFIGIQSTPINDPMIK